MEERRPSKPLVGGSNPPGRIAHSVAARPLRGALPRLGLMIFPFFMALAMSTRTQRVAHTSYVAASATLLAIASGTFAVYGWVG